ncbi:MAG TPA: HNH endonuclease signature motif containing protein [Longimicrobiales bacterium]|nr:HNH endonuclease signature motif containing protein [Longimicrobiales bacterium]
MTRRSSVPKAARESAEKAFKGRCALCEAEAQQIHHIDGDNANNDPLNLLPVCGTCHTRQHGPDAIEPDRLAFYREHRHPGILAPQFRPLFRRMRFLRAPEGLMFWDMARQAQELQQLVEHHNMGSYYAPRVARAVGGGPHILDVYNPPSERENLEEARRYRDRIEQERSGVYELILELIDYQPWADGPPSSRSD